MLRLAFPYRKSHIRYAYSLTSQVSEEVEVAGEALEAVEFSEEVLEAVDF